MILFFTPCWRSAVFAPRRGQADFATEFVVDLIVPRTQEELKSCRYLPLDNYRPQQCCVGPYLPHPTRNSLGFLVQKLTLPVLRELLRLRLIIQTSLLGNYMPKSARSTGIFNIGVPGACRYVKDLVERVHKPILRRVRIARWNAFPGEFLQDSHQESPTVAVGKRLCL